MTRTPIPNCPQEDKPPQPGAAEIQGARNPTQGIDMRAPQILIQNAYIALRAPVDLASFAPLTVQSVASQVEGFLNPDPNRFEYDPTTGTVTDPLTGLMWGDETDELTPDDAFAACKACRQGGYSDWTQSNLRQVLSIVDYTRHNPVLPRPFKTSGNFIWTADETPWSKAEKRAGSYRSFFNVGMLNGYVNYNYAYLRFRSRPVRRAAPASQ